MTIKEIEQQVIEEFSNFEEWMDKYDYLIDLGKSLPLIDEQYKTDQHKITGCQAQVWVHARYEEGKVVFTADSDALITKGIISLMVRVLSNQSPAEIIHADLAFIDTIGLKEHLSPTRSNGLVSMVKQLKLYALVFKTKEERVGL